MTTWDGNGVDPWLPQRLAHETRVVEAEQRMYDTWWGAFSSWLVRVTRGVLGSVGPPDPLAVWALAPLWAEHMTRFIQGPVLRTAGLAYEALFGAGYRYDSRPAVVAHLAEVSNRMVRTPDRVFDVIAAEIAKGAGEGESVTELAERVETVLSVTQTATWRNRAVTVARTETLGALNAGRSDAFRAIAADTGDDFEEMWLATLDHRVRDAHRQADGQRVPLGQPFVVGGEPLARPGDPAGSASNVIQCRCTTLLLLAGDDVDQSNRGGGDWDDWDAWAASEGINLYDVEGSQ